MEASKVITSLCKVEDVISIPFANPIGKKYLQKRKERDICLLSYLRQNTGKNRMWIIKHVTNTQVLKTMNFPHLSVDDQILTTNNICTDALK